MVDETAKALRDVMSDWRKRAANRQNDLTKPPGSLGRLEEIANRLCAIQQTLAPSVENAAIFVFAGDHGVCEEGVNPYPQAVTREMLRNFARGGAAINALARVAGAMLTVVDVGVIGEAVAAPGVRVNKIGQGTANFCTGPAMTGEEAVAAIAVGRELADEAISRGATVLGIGEMGIGNTTVAAALASALTGRSAEYVCGRGTGADETVLARKKDAVRRAVELHATSLDSGLAMLAALGGFEIAAMCGVCLAAAGQRCAVVMDGFISTAAAALAVNMNPIVREFLIASHRSLEPGHQVLLDLLEVEPLLDLRMRLGEGTGAALAIPIIRSAVAAFNEMATFRSAGVSEAS